MLLARSKGLGRHQVHYMWYYMGIYHCGGSFFGRSGGTVATLERITRVATGSTRAASYYIKMSGVICMANITTFAL